MRMNDGLYAVAFTSAVFLSISGGAMGQTTSAPDTAPVATDTDNDDGFDMGWLGLLGLIGLAGLRGHKDDRRDTIR